jgi:hypothetical protein
MKNTENHNEPKLKIEGLSESDLKRNAFKTPDGYFNNLTPRIMESVRNSEKPVATVVFDWKRVLIPTFSIAAVVLTAWFLIRPADTATPDFDGVLASLSISELTEYADLNATELVSYELVDYDQPALVETQLSQEEIIDYLNEEEIELNSIIDEIEI